eukprot:GHVP01054588.1.p1 GENE.GHVP01054588.1~~GHVP01054588.1.p1  ORF type:complete len:101 (-),score=9.90 GHVP01054588.1:483-785(-)
MRSLVNFPFSSQTKKTIGIYKIYVLQINRIDSFHLAFTKELRRISNVPEKNSLVGNAEGGWEYGEEFGIQKRITKVASQNNFFGEWSSQERSSLKFSSWA